MKVFIRPKNRKILDFHGPTGKWRYFIKPEIAAFTYLRKVTRLHSLLLEEERGNVAKFLPVNGVSSFITCID